MACPKIYGSALDKSTKNTEHIVCPTNDFSLEKKRI
jgi:hypothetical protein